MARRGGLKNKPIGAVNRERTPQRKPGQPGEARDTERTGMTPKGLASPGSTSSELIHVCPQPRRAYPGNVQEETAPESPISDVVNHELREVLSGKAANWNFFDVNGGPDCRPGSASLSTNVGTPAPTLCPTTPGATPGPDRSCCFSPGLVSKPGTPSPENKDESAAQGSTSAQGRKVFVGGVPQDMTQEELLKLFSEHAEVKKAWLQKYRAGQSNSHPPNHHRGFGFVIFTETSSVDRLLGDNFSRYLVLRDGKRLEVKRAQSSSEIDQKTSGKKVEKAKRGQPQFSEPDMPGDGAQQQALADPAPCLPPPNTVMVPLTWQGGSNGQACMAPAVMQVPQYTAMPCGMQGAHGVQGVQGVNVYTPVTTNADPAQLRCPSAAVPAVSAVPMVQPYPQGGLGVGQTPQYATVLAAPGYGVPANGQQMWVLAPAQMTSPQGWGSPLAAQPQPQLPQQQPQQGVIRYDQNPFEVCQMLEKVAPDFYED